MERPASLAASRLRRTLWRDSNGLAFIRSLLVRIRVLPRIERSSPYFHPSVRTRATAEWERKRDYRSSKPGIIVASGTPDEFTARDCSRSIRGTRGLVQLLLNSVFISNFLLEDARRCFQDHFSRLFVEHSANFCREKFLSLNRNTLQRARSKIIDPSVLFPFYKSVHVQN